MSTVTITSTYGPGLTATAMVLNNVTKVIYDFVKKVVTVTYGTPSVTSDFSFGLVATVTHTVSGVDSTITIST